MPGRTAATYTTQRPTQEYWKPWQNLNHMQHSRLFPRTGISGILCSILLAFWACSQPEVAPGKDPSNAKNARVLVFTYCKGYKHASITAGAQAISQLGVKNNFGVKVSQDPALFNLDSLKNFQAVLFLSTTGDILNTGQQAAFEHYIQSGGGFVGIHAAADCEYNWPWYNRLLGAYFASHPSPQQASIQVVDKTHAATRMLPDSWQRFDEWYNFKAVQPHIRVLARLDESSYQGGTHGSQHPIAWYHDFDGGRAFYTGGGHTQESFSEPLFLAHLLGGIQYALGR